MQDDPGSSTTTMTTLAEDRELGRTDATSHAGRNRVCGRSRAGGGHPGSPTATGMARGFHGGLSAASLAHRGLCPTPLSTNRMPLPCVMFAQASLGERGSKKKSSTGGQRIVVPCEAPAHGNALRVSLLPGQCVSSYISICSGSGPGPGRAPSPKTALIPTDPSSCS